MVTISSVLSEKVLNIKPSATLEIDAKAKQLRKEGKDIVIFGAGEPDFNTPDNIKRAAIRAIDSNISKYTPPGGIRELRQAVAEKFKKANNISYDENEVLVSCGGKHSLYNAIMSILNKDDEVILPAPYWVSYAEMIRLAEAKAVFCGTGKNFKLTAENVEEKLAKKTKLLILNSPNNPTGAVIEHEEIKKIAKLAVDNNFYVISDEVYEYFTYNGKKHLSIASLNDEIKNLAITINSVSKAYAMTGWRIGYCGANREIIQAMKNLQSHTTSNPSNVAQMAALEALTGPQDSIKQMIKAFDERRKYMDKRLNEMSGISCAEPEGAFYAFPDISKTNISPMGFASRLLDEASVAIVPGTAFGSDKHIRLSYAAPMQDITIGLERMENWLMKVNDKK